jgi:hypothetical protein
MLGGNVLAAFFYKTAQMEWFQLISWQNKPKFIVNYLVQFAQTPLAL